MPRGSHHGGRYMFTYRCFLLDRADRISSTADIECAGDDEAQKIAGQMLRHRLSYDYAKYGTERARSFIRFAIQKRNRCYDRILARRCPTATRTGSAHPETRVKHFVSLMRKNGTEAWQMRTTVFAVLMTFLTVPSALAQQVQSDSSTN